MTAAEPQGPSLGPELLLRTLGMAVIATDLEGRVEQWNATAESLYGWREAEAVGRPVAELIADEASWPGAELVIDSLRTGRPWVGDLIVRRRDGSTFPALVAVSAVRVGDRSVGVSFASADLGDAIWPLLGRMSDALLVMDHTGQVVYASPAVTRLFGWSTHELVGTAVASLVHRDDLPALERAFEGDGRRPEPPAAVDLRVARVDESWIWMQASVTDLGDSGGAMWLLRDITLQRAESERSQARSDQLQRALESRIVIEQAKGFLAASAGITPADAFVQLRHHARDRNIDLHELAQRVVSRQEPLPGLPGTTPPDQSGDDRGGTGLQG